MAEALNTSVPKALSNPPAPAEVRLPIMPATVQPVLVWASSQTFALSVGQLLNGSHLGWEVTTDLHSVLQRSPDRWSALLLDGSETRVMGGVHRVRAAPLWWSFPIILLDGLPRPEMQEDRHLLQMTMPREASQLEVVLFRLTRPDRATQKTVLPEARTSYRHICLKPVSASMDLLLVDLSETGAQVEAPFYLPPGTVLHLNLARLNPELQRPIAFKVLTSLPFGATQMTFRMRGRFEDLDADLERRIRRALMHLQTHQARKLV